MICHKFFIPIGPLGAIKKYKPCVTTKMYKINPLVPSPFLKSPFFRLCVLT